jgi:hypothetical protein
MKQSGLQILLLVALGFGTPLSAWGQAPTNEVGGYTVNTPGKPPVMIVPDGRGGYVEYTPGQEPPSIVFNSDGGYTFESQMQGAERPLEFPHPGPPKLSLDDFDMITPPTVSLSDFEEVK